ncbi:MAG: metallophosphoesterase family protein [Planctomycetales bacterium]|nr:metallophosphoesterase family protein [Planctomycetales bacterium]
MRSQNKQLFLGLYALFVALGLTPPWLAANDSVLADGAQPVQWRLIWKEDPARTATLSWNTSAAGTSHQVHLREEGTDEAMLVAAQRNGRYTGESPELYYHHTELTNLKPGTVYHVVLESDGTKSPEMFFVTAPAEDVPVSIMFGADSRSGLEERRQMNAMLASMVAESYQAGRVPILALAHGGDYIRSGTQLDQWSVWMTDHELTVGPDGRLLPIIPARGNHDMGEPFNEVFAFPAQEQTNYYALNIGPQVRLVTLNTETSVAGDQTDWLKAELETSRPANRWLLAQYHKPAFPAVKPPWINLTHWVPLFERYNVDLVCEGDGHNIKRTPPIRNFAIDPTGVVYIGEGGLGVGQRTPKTDRWYLRPPHAKTGSEHHVQLLTFDEQKITYRVILLGGKLFDEHHLPARTPEQRQAP